MNPRCHTNDFSESQFNGVSVSFDCIPCLHFCVAHFCHTASERDDCWLRVTVQRGLAIGESHHCLSCPRFLHQSFYWNLGGKKIRILDIDGRSTPLCSRKQSSPSFLVSCNAFQKALSKKEGKVVAKYYWAYHGHAGELLTSAKKIQREEQRNQVRRQSSQEEKEQTLSMPKMCRELE